MWWPGASCRRRRPQPSRPTRARSRSSISPISANTGHDLPEGLEPGLNETAFFDPVNFTYPFGVHIAEVEVDTETGETTITRYVAVDDCGNVINPMIVDGQVHGGVAQGVAQALWEEVVYDENGQLHHRHADGLRGAVQQRPAHVRDRAPPSPPRRSTRSASRAWARRAPSPPPR